MPSIGFCTFGLHDWPIWRDIKSGPIFLQGSNSIIGYCTRQERRCIVCGLVENNTSATYLPLRDNRDKSL